MSTNERPPASPEDVALAHEDANTWAKIIDRKIEKAGRDPLTGLMQRKQFETAVRREMRSSKRFDSPVSLVLLDIDHFKKFNDSHGHKAGDKALIEIAEVMKDEAREVDLLGRWGGEEFVTMYPGTDIEGAGVVAERFRSAVEKKLCEENGLVCRNLTVSIGIAQWDGSESIDAWIDGADQAMYLAKNKGRNKVAERQLDGSFILLSQKQASE
jgi:diguanylate cyclase (GGDEF)-like protein